MAESREIDAVEAMLDELASIGPGGGSGARQIKKISYTHDSMIDLIIQGSKRPGGISQNQIAAAFGYTPGWVSIILASDAFKARLAERREEIIDPELRQTVKERMEALYILSMQVLHDKMSRPSAQISDQLALRAAELGARGVGVGGLGHAPVAPARPDDDRLTRLADRIVGLASSARERIVDGEVLPALPSR